MLFTDANFLILCPSPDDKQDLIFKFQRASKASAFNDIIRVQNKSDHTEFMSQFKNFNPTDFLNQAFEHHVDLFNYHGSNLQPYSLLSLVMYITKF